MLTTTRGDLKSPAVVHCHSAIPELPILDGWRRELVGQDLLDLLNGKKSLRIEEGKRILSSPAQSA